MVSASVGALRTGKNAIHQVLTLSISPRILGIHQPETLGNHPNLLKKNASRSEKAILVIAILREIPGHSRSNSGPEWLSRPNLCDENPILGAISLEQSSRKIGWTPNFQHQFHRSSFSKLGCCAPVTQIPASETIAD